MRRALVASFGVAAVLIACGSRGPLDDGPSVVVYDAGEGGASSSSGAIDGAAIVDAAHDAGPIACAGCVVGTCGPSIAACIGQPDCLSVFTCITTSCLGFGGDAGFGGFGSGSIDTKCLLGCATKNPAGAIQVLQIFQCVTGTCSPDCGGLLGGLGGGLGGLGGLGGGGGRKIDELDTTPVDRETFDLAFSPWPELVSRP